MASIGIIDERTQMRVERVENKERQNTTDGIGEGI